MEDAFQDFDVVVIEVGNHYPAWEHHNFTSQLHKLLAHDQLRRACMQRACVLASAPASHFAGGVATYSSYVRAQEDCLAHKFATACGGVDDAHFRGSHEAQQASMRARTPMPAPEDAATHYAHVASNQSASSRPPAPSVLDDRDASFDKDEF